MRSLLPSDSSLVFTWSFSPKFICTLIFQRLFHACLQGCSMTQQGFFTLCPLHSSWTAAPSKESYRVRIGWMAICSLSCLCHSVSPVILCSALPRMTSPSDSICPPQLPLLLSLPSSVLDLNIVYPLRCTDVFLPLPSLLYWLVFCLTLSPSLVYIHPLLLFPIWCWETHLSKSQFPDSEWVPH